MTALEKQLQDSVALNERRGALARVEQPAPLARSDAELSVQDIIAQVRKVQEVMQAVMKPNEHYGVIPGTGDKPTLLKPGAEKLCLLFRLAPEYHIEERREDGHLEVLSRCELVHVPTGQRRGSGLGMCSTRESKYAYRKGERKCPKCEKEAIRKSKEEYGGGWYCNAKAGGCGAKFNKGDKAIESQDAGRVANPDLADQYNTVLKMANKRSLVAAVLNVTAASDIFTQDLEDLPTPGRSAVHALHEEKNEWAGVSHDDSLFDELMGDMAAYEERLPTLQDRGQVAEIRFDLGSKAQPTARIPAAIQRGMNERKLNRDQHKALSKIWARLDRQLAKLETSLPEPPPRDVIESFVGADEERQPGED